MYFGPFRWPPLSIWLTALALTIVFGTLAALGVKILVPMVIAVVVILAIAAPRPARELGAEELRDSRPED
jgi:hypothetical protein